MTRYLTTFAVWCLLAGSASAGDRDDSKAWQALNGDWRLVQTVYTPNDGTTPVAEQFHLLGKNVEIKDGWLRSREPGNKLAFKLNIDASQLPPAIDLKLPGEKQDQVFRGSYIAGRAQLTIHIGIGDKRPRGRANDANQVMLVLVRPPE